MIRKLSKKARVLDLLLQRGDRGLNRFEALELAHDSVLPSTVSALHKRGVFIDAVPEDVPGYGGHATRVARYRIPPGDREDARRILSEMTKRKASAAGTADASSGAVGLHAHVRPSR